MNKYRPPQGFWREVKKLDKKLLELCPPPVSSKIGNLAINVSRVAWAEDTESPAPVVWESYSKPFLGKIGGSLVQFEYIKSDTTSDLGALEREYRYNAALHALRTNTRMHPNLDGINSNSYVSQDKVIESQLHKNHPGAEDYSIFIEELRRGASGEFLIALEIP
jgi:hypothetical protein